MIRCFLAIIVLMLILATFLGCVENQGDTPAPISKTESVPNVTVDESPVDMASGTITNSNTSVPSVTVTLSGTSANTTQPSAAPLPIPISEPIPIPSPTPEPTPEPAPTMADQITQAIADTNPILPASLSNVFEILEMIDSSTNDGTISEEEAQTLEGSLQTKFGQWISIRVDNINVQSPNSLREFFDLQAIHKTSQYERLIDTETQRYEINTIKDRFNQWIRNRVKEIDKNNSDSLGQFLDVKLYQSTDTYDQLSTSVTNRYIQGLMIERFNEWIRNFIDDIDTSSSSAFQYFLDIEYYQTTDIYEELVLEQTHEYIEGEKSNKFNEWLTNLADGMNPDSENFIEEMESFSLIQDTTGYQELIDTLTMEYLEQQLTQKVGEHMSDKVNSLGSKSSSKFPGKLFSLVQLMQSDLYDEFCPQAKKEYVKDRLRIALGTANGSAPKVVCTLPKNEQTDVPVMDTIMVVFDQAMTPLVTESAITITPEITCDSVWISANWYIPDWGTGDGYLIALLQPKSPLAYNTTYTFGINKDALSVQSIKPDYAHSFSFTTKDAGASPQIDSVLPTDGETSAPIGGTIQITFDQEMDTASVESAIKISPKIDYSVCWKDGNTVAILQPLTSLAPNSTFEIKIGAEAVTTNSVALGQDYTFSFFTGFQGKPEVLGTMPGAAQTGIMDHYPIRVSFNRSMDIDSVKAAISVTPDIDCRLVWYEADFVLQIKPKVKLPTNTNYSIEIDTNLKSSVGSPLEQSYNFNFTTIEE